jgi:hypothetical protein
VIIRTPVATLSPPPVATLSPRAHAQAAVTRGDQARANGDLAQALAEYNRAVEFDSAYAATYAARRISPKISSLPRSRI